MKRFTILMALLFFCLVMFSQREDAISFVISRNAMIEESSTNNSLKIINYSTLLLEVNTNYRI